jgi:hypothetical protein
MRVENYKLKKTPLGELRISGRILLKWIVNKWKRSICIEPVWNRQWKTVASRVLNFGYHIRREIY